MPVPVRARTDPEHGGRWVSLRAGSREWLWLRCDPRRDSVRPGASFVDAGGLEECLPTVRGHPDHGDAWTRPWQRHGDTETVQTADYLLSRRLDTDGNGLTAHYRLTGRAGWRFVWTAHALLDVSAAAILELPAGTPTRIYPEAAPLLGRPWPAGCAYLTGSWPAPYGLRLEELGPDDGTAVGAIAVGCRTTRVHDTGHLLEMTLDVAGAQPCSVALWRNLGGFPPDAPYRSVGVEPMLGAVFELATAGQGDAVVLPADGTMTWWLTIKAWGPGCD